MGKAYKKIALAISLVLMVLWSILGTGTSLAWFTDTDDDVVNVFHFGEFELAVSHRLENGEWEPVEQDTKVFDDEALYEPGYVQVVYLKIENRGTVAFDFKTAVTVTDYTVATNVFGTKFHLQDHLRFGLVTASSEAELYGLVSARDPAEGLATMPLSNYSTGTEALAPGDCVYMALIVRMPEDVGNVANYREDVIPRVELGLIVSATQQSD